MTDSCSTCFFFKTFNVLKGGNSVPVGVCARNAPLTQSSPGNQNQATWPEIPDPTNWWCGDWLQSYPGGLQWTGYNGVVSPGSGSWTSIDLLGISRFAQFGKLILYQYQFGIITNGTGAVSVILTLPTVPVHQMSVWGHCSAGGGVIPTKALVGQVSTVTSQVEYTAYDGTYPGGNGVYFHLGGLYETP